MSLILITPPAVEPVTVDDIKVAGRIDGTAFDAQITNLLIPAIRQEAEHRLARRLITQTVELLLDGFPSSIDIDLTLPDAQAITSIKYLDGTGVEQTLSTSVYQLDADNVPSRALLKVGQSWPETQNLPSSVRIRYTVGYGNAGTDVPSAVRLWIIAHVVQALDHPDGLDAAGLQPLPYVDRLLDAEAVLRVA